MYYSLTSGRPATEVRSDTTPSSAEDGHPHLIERIESRNGIHTVETAAELGFGSREYTLIEL